MQIVPVLDIKAGLVVRGVMGDRDNYRPIETPLSATAEPVDVAKGLADLCGFPAFYIADLDAIEGRAANRDAVEALQRALPAPEFWIDRGVRGEAEARALLDDSRTVAVVGSESLEDADALDRLSREARLVLSLDFRGGDFVGPRAILDRPQSWPRRVIVMTLQKVGSGAGPDFGRLAEIKALAGERLVFAAGGVRGREDIEALAAAGIAGALVSTALHQGRLDREALRAFAG